MTPIDDRADQPNLTLRPAELPADAPKLTGITADAGEPLGAPADQPRINTGANKAMHLRYCVYLFCLWLPLVAAAEVSQWQDLSGVPAAAERYLTGVLRESFPGDQTQIRIAAIDPRLRLTACDKPLTYDTHSKQLGASNVTLRVVCPGSSPWSFYLSSTVERLRPILVASRNLGRGDTLTEADLTLEQRDVSTLGNNTLSDPARAIGQQTRRPISQGDSIRLTLLTPPRVIEKGDAVSIKATAGGISVLSTGIAMTGGKVGEQIRVQNQKSERVIKARVTGQGQVEVLM